LSGSPDEPSGSSPPDELLLQRTVEQATRWPHGPVSSATFELVGREHGLSGGTVHRVKAQTAGGEITLILKREDREPTRRALLFHELVGNQLAGAVPFCYGGRLHADAGLLLLEEVTGEQGDVLLGCTDEQARAVVRTLCRIHASSWTPDASAHPSDLPRWEASGWDEQRWSDRLAGALWRFPGLFTLDVRRKLESWPARVSAATDELRAGPATWIHSDAHLDNVVWRADASAVLLDWCGAAIRPPAIDLVRLLLEGLANGARLVERRNLLVETAIAELASRGVGGVDEVVLGRWLELAAAPLIQGVIGWAGRPDDGPTPGRMPALGEQACRSVVAWLSASDRPDSL
jgi:hypothetical protein